MEMSLIDDKTEQTIPAFEPNLSNSCNGLIMQAINWSVNSIYEYENKEQLLKYYHLIFTLQVFK